MSKLHGKQIKSSSVELGKLSGTGIVSLTTGAELSFLTGSKLYYADAPTTNIEVANKAYVDSVAQTYTAGNGLLLTSLEFSLAPTSAGGGLGYTTGVYNVNVNSDALEISADAVALKSTISGARTFSNKIDFSNGIDVINSATFSAGVSIGGDATISGDLTVNGLTTFLNTQELEVTDNIITLAKGNIAGSTVDAGIEVDRGTDPKAKLFWDESADDWVAGLSGSELSLLTDVGNGLSRTNNVVSLDPTVGGDGLSYTTGVLAVNTGQGLQTTTDNVEVQLGANSGLDFSANGLIANIDNSTLVINGTGQIEVDKDFLKSEPVYDLTTLATSYTNNDSVTNIALSATPSKFSRIQVIVNGQKQKVSSGTNSLDAYFVDTAAPATPLTFANLTTGDVLVWNALNAGFSLESGDDVEIIYEA